VRELRCSICDRVAATFTTAGGATIYVGILGKHLRTERPFVDTNELAAIERFMKEEGWVEVKADDVTPAYTIGDEPSFSLDAYCPACDRVYCNDHMTTRAHAHAGYGEWIVATCPSGHERKVYDDPR
jgi:hypothetical protein